MTAPPYHARKLQVEAGAANRLESVAKDIGLYDSRHEAQKDGWAEILNLLMDRADVPNGGYGGT